MERRAIFNSWNQRPQAADELFLMSEDIAKALKAYRIRQSEIRLAAGPDWKDTGLVFTTTMGTPIEPSSLVKDFKRLLGKANLPTSFRFHDLHHTAATLMLAEDVSMNTVKKVLGHSTIAVTANTYAHVMREEMQAVADKMGAVLAVGGQT